jgi:hypothetical protein
MDHDNKYQTPILESRLSTAAALGISVRAVDYLVATRQLPTRRIGHRRLIPRSAIERFAKSDHPSLLKPPVPRSKIADRTAGKNQH